jgi:ribosomal protein L21E
MTDYEKLFQKIMESWDEVRFNLSPGPSSDIYFFQGNIFVAVGKEDGSVSLQVYNTDGFKKIVDEQVLIFCKEHGFSGLDELLESNEYGDLVGVVMETLELQNANA